MRRSDIERKRAEQDEKVDMVMRIKEQENTQRKLALDKKRHSKTVTMKIIQSEQEKQREALRRKIQHADAVQKQIQDEKAQLNAEKQRMKKEAEIEKQEIMKAFEKMKVQGKMDPKVMRKFGLSTSSIGQTGMGPAEETAASIGQSARGMRPAPLAPGSSQRKRTGSAIPKSSVSSAGLQKRSKQLKGGTPADSDDLAEEAKRMRKMSAVSAKKRVDELRKKFNLELLKILEEEQNQESLRE